MKYNINDFIQLIAALRHPKTGCPWDLEQNYQSIIPCLIEETYEVVEAIEQGSIQDLKEELGDLLLQVVFFSQLATEENKFDFNDVIQIVSEKIIRRHPHVFGENKVNSAEEALQNWNAVKQTENQIKGHNSILDNVPNALPALMRAEKLQKKCSKVGFDWDNSLQVLAKVEEELNEVKQELAQAQQDQDKIEEEIGDLFFALVNLSRHLKVKPEESLRKANAKFERRFRTVEQTINKQGKTLAQSNLHEMDFLWEQVKKAEG